MSTNAPIRIWRVPVLLGVVAAFGLIAALLSDGLGDYLAWFALAIPVAVVVWFVPPRKPRNKREAESSAASDYV